MGHLAGDLSIMPLPDLVIWFANRGVTGVLRVERASVRKEFTLVDGRTIRAASNDPREYFGQFLIHFGFLTEDQLQRAFETQKETKVLLGRILVMIGIVPEEQVIQTLRVKMSESMLDAFRWDTGRFQFEDESVNEERAEIEVEIPLMEIHREGTNRQKMWEQYRSIFPDEAMLLHVFDNRLPATATPDTLDGRIIALARHGLSIEAITLELHATDYQIAARLYELWRAQTIEPREPSLTQPVPNVTIPPVGETHADLAKKAMASGDYPSALMHVQIGSRQDPNNPEFSEIRSKIAAVAQESDALPAPRAVPTLVGELAPETLRRMPAKHRYILERIDGRRSIQAIMQVSPMDDVEAQHIIGQLKATGIISY